MSIIRCLVFDLEVACDGRLHVKASILHGLDVIITDTLGVDGVGATNMLHAGLGVELADLREQIIGLLHAVQLTVDALDLGQRALHKCDGIAISLASGQQTLLFFELLDKRGSLFLERCHYGHSPFHPIWAILIASCNASASEKPSGSSDLAPSGSSFLAAPASDAFASSLWSLSLLLSD